MPHADGARLNTLYGAPLFIVAQELNEELCTPHPNTQRRSTEYNAQLSRMACSSFSLPIPSKNTRDRRDCDEIE